mgnify:CR=1 FL=1
MTYRELLERLTELEEEQLAESVMASVDNEMYLVTTVQVQEGDDQLRDGHPYLEIT